MRKLIYLLPLLLFVCFGCEESFDEDLGGVAKVVSTNPFTGSEIANGSILTINFNDAANIENRKVFVNGIPAGINGNQVSWNIAGLVPGMLVNLAITWTNTDGSDGAYLFTFRVKKVGGNIGTTQGTQGTQNLPPKGKIEVYLDAYEEMTVIHEGLDKAKFVLDQVNVKEYGQLYCKLDEVSRALYEGADTIEKLNKIKETFSAGQQARLDDLDGRSLKVNLEINEKRRAHFVEDNKRILEFMKGLVWAST